MKGVNRYWSLFNKRKNLQIDGLTFSQLSLFTFTMSDDYLLEWLAWHEGAEDWENLISYKADLDPTSHEYVFRDQPLAPQVTAAETEGAQINYKESKRLTKRIQKKLKVFVRTPKKIIETETLDISLMGMMVAAVMPDDFDKVELTLLSGGDKIDAIAEVIKDENRNRLKLLRVSNLEKLSAWLVS